MTRKQAGIVSAVAFAALVKPMGNLMGFVDLAWYVACQSGMSPHLRIFMAIADAFGLTAAQWANILIGYLAAAVPALLIYRYLRRRDFAQVCESCAAHKVRAWSLLLAFFVLTLLHPVSVPIPFEPTGIPLDEAMEQSPTATLELRLCHPENDRLERELKANGRLTDEVLAAAPHIDGYSIMRVRGEDDSVCYVCDDVELSMEDIVSAKAYASLFNEGTYEVSAKLTPEGRARLARLTCNYMPYGAKNPSSHGRALAIIVNGELVTVPVIQTKIDGGEFSITGKFTKEEAVTLAAALNARQGERE